MSTSSVASLLETGLYFAAGDTPGEPGQVAVDAAHLAWSPHLDRQYVARSAARLHKHVLNARAPGWHHEPERGGCGLHDGDGPRRGAAPYSDLGDAREVHPGNGNQVTTRHACHGGMDRREERDLGGDGASLRPLATHGIRGRVVEHHDLTFVEGKVAAKLAVEDECGI